MRILLIAPTFHYKDKHPSLLSFSDFPSGIAYVAAALKEAGHEVIGLNPNNAPQYESTFYMLTNKLSKLLDEEKPDLIGLGGLCIDYAFFRDAMELIRKFAPNTPIVLGGGIVNNDREFIFNHLKPDFAIIGEAEETVVKLADALNTKEYSHIDNLSYWQEGKAVFNQVNHTYRPVDERPYPNYEIFNVQDMLDDYSMATRLLYRYPRTHPRVFNIVTARGCPFNCSFCIHRGSAPYRARPIPDVMEEIRVSYEKYKFNILLILDELFAVNKQRMKDFCNGVLEGREKYGWDFDWTFQTHASAALDYDTLVMAKKAGCFSFSYGIESASPKVLESMNKKIKPSQIIEAIELANQVGIGFSGNLIFGDTAETPSTIYESLDFFFKYCRTACVFMTLLSPYPGNKLFDTCVEKGIIGNKAAYYASIDEGIYNMTAMDNNTWFSWVNFFTLFERSWLWVKDTEVISLTKEDYSDPVTRYRQLDTYRLETRCPYCHEALVYREMLRLQKTETPLFLGTNCNKCHKRIRINLKAEKQPCQISL